jgi:ABC-type dipeptide/oligopeptide/nickel transport system ATPase subunit
MPTFNIIKENNINKTFRVAQVMSDFDIKIEHSNEKFMGNIEFPDNWNIGLICGGSGTGKTTIAKELFYDDIIDNFKWSEESVIDNMPKDLSVKEIEKMFYAVGFGSVPSWLKPYSVLSNGEKMRVDLARALLEKDFIVFDEFTSVVDRQVAKTACMAINKAIKNTNKKFIAISCHKDIIEWLQPDWLYDTDRMQQVFQLAHDQKKDMKLGVVGEKNGKFLGSIII